MPIDLEGGKRIYDYLGRHPGLYRFIRWSVCFGREAGLQKRALGALKLKAGDTVLDLGCGAGVNFALLEEKVGAGGRIIALDYCEGMLAQAKALSVRRGWGNIEFIQGDAARMTLPENALDGAVCTFALSAMPNDDGAICRVAASLKPGAQFVVFDAKAFTGPAKFFNPVAGPFFKHTTNWDYEKDVVGKIKMAFGRTEVHEFNGGCNYIAVATRIT
jgi:ubiquinone/menaquinone biosynthesis C-methylase UbiE